MEAPGSHGCSRAKNAASSTYFIQEYPTPPVTHTHHRAAPYGAPAPSSWQISSSLDLLPPLCMEACPACANCSGIPQALRSWQSCDCPSIRSSFTPKMSLEPCSAKSHSSLLPAARCRSFKGNQAPEGNLLEISTLVGNCDPRTEMNQLWPGPGPTVPRGPFPEVQEFL